MYTYMSCCMAKLSRNGVTAYPPLPHHYPYPLTPPPSLSFTNEVIRFDYLSLFQTQYPSTPQPQSSMAPLALSDVAVTLPRTTVGQTPAGVGTLCAVRGRPSYRTAPASGI